MQKIKYFCKIIFVVNTFKQNRYHYSLPNQFRGLARGPIDHNASSVINSISADAITMGDCLILTSVPATDLLPRVQTSPALTNQVIYGIAVGGDTDGIYGEGGAASDESTQATSGAGQGVVVVTQGRCLARVAGLVQNGASSTTDSAIAPGDALVPDPGDTGRLVKSAGDGAGFPSNVIARALQDGDLGDSNILAVDVQREGALD